MDLIQSVPYSENQRTLSSESAMSPFARDSAAMHSASIRESVSQSNLSHPVVSGSRSERNGGGSGSENDSGTMDCATA
jgi:hypothetical protein